jgi:hypothetical protein
MVRTLGSGVHRAVVHAAAGGNGSAVMTHTPCAGVLKGPRPCRGTTAENPSCHHCLSAAAGHRTTFTTRTSHTNAAHCRRILLAPTPASSGLTSPTCA